MQETSTKPYILRALHDWCTDNGYTPHIVVAVDENTLVPAAHIHDGQITLNVGLLATNALVMGNEYIEFEARFSGNVEHIVVPVAAVSAIYARETGTGMGFEVTESHAYPGIADDSPSTTSTAGTQDVKTTQETSESKDKSSGKGSHLKIIK